MSRRLVIPPTPRVPRALVDALAVELAGAPEDCVRFFATLLADVPYRTAAALMRDLAVHPSACLSRFQRAGLPTPKRLVAEVQLVRLAYVLDDVRRSITAAATMLDLSSQSVACRFVRLHTGLTAEQFRREWTGERRLAHFVATCLRPHRATWRQFSPLVAEPHVERLARERTAAREHAA